MKIAFFDFDGTITKSDTFVGFIKFARGRNFFYLTIFIFIYFYGLYILKIISAETSKKMILKFYVGGYSKNTLQQLAGDYIELINTNGIVKPEMISLIKEYKKEGTEVVVVSASMDLWVEQFCLIYSIPCISTTLAYSSKDIFEGEFKTPNCKDIEKVTRIRKIYTLENYIDIIVYGDSSGDKEMMELATVKNWVK